MPGILTVWEYIKGCAKQYRRALAIYLMSALSYSYGIKTYRAMNSPGHVKNVVYGLNATDKVYFKGKMKFIGKLASNDISNIEMLSSASK